MTGGGDADTGTNTTTDKGTDPGTNTSTGLDTDTGTNTSTGLDTDADTNTKTDISSVVLITVDSLRADAIGPYDEDRHTPVMSELADRGTVFERAYAEGNWTPFSFPSILASEPVFQSTGAIGIEGARPLASVLAEAGVSTAGYNAANGFLTSYWGYDQGFDRFDAFVTSVGSSIYSRYLATHPTVEAWLQLATSPVRRMGSWLRGNAADRPFLDTSRMFDVEHAAIDFIEQEEDPSFLWVHYMDPHTPYVPAPRYIREVTSDRLGTHRMLHAHTRTGLGWEVGPGTLRDLRMLYQAAVRQVDASIGRLLETIEESGRADETAVIVVGDHGEEFQEHGHLAHYPKLYEELIHVPFIVDVPGATADRIETPVGLDTIPPTIAALFGVEEPERWTGRSLDSHLYTGEEPAGKPIVSVTVRGEEVTSQPIPRKLSEGDLLVSVRDRDWTYIQNIRDGSTELYYRPDDAEEQTDLSGRDSDTTNTIIDRFGSIATDHAATLFDKDDGDADEAAVDEDLETRLSALGYR